MQNENIEGNQWLKCLAKVSVCSCILPFLFYLFFFFLSTNSICSLFLFHYVHWCVTFSLSSYDVNARPDFQIPP